ncbi:MAG: 50S ribosomal protein L30 [Alphaproteobacteria bacterium]|nr:50S ribosomal protein L30 [Alphaproteobacteria bacterium]
MTSAYHNIDANSPTITVTQIKSTIRRPENQTRIVKSLGLGKLHRTRIIPNTPENRGRVRKVAHLLRVE